MSTRILAEFGLFLAVVAIASPLAAQEARQGTPAEIPVTEFTSPMIVTTAFAATNRSFWGDGGWFAIEEYRRLGAFTCDGVSIRRNFSQEHNAWDPGLQLSVRPKGPDAVSVAARVTIHNPVDNHDKAVNVMLEVLDGDQVLRTAYIGPIKLKDNGSEAGQSVSFVMPTALLDKTPAPTLRLTVSAKDY